eukprot:1679040-Pyramimonas_sp.AAC.1
MKRSHSSANHMEYETDWPKRLRRREEDKTTFMRATREWTAQRGGGRNEMWRMTMPWQSTRAQGKAGR